MTSAQDVQILIVTGGHDFDREAFFEVFDSFNGVKWKEAVQPEANKMFLEDKVDQFDVVVFYDMFQTISDAEQKAFLKMLKKGKPLLFLHHSLASYQNWDEYLKIVGGKYYEKNLIKEKPSIGYSNFLHGTKVHVEPFNSTHPVLNNVLSFELFDEVYGNTEVLKSVTPLLKTNHPNSTEVIGWEHKYKSSKIIYLQPGHGKETYADENYRRLIYQSIKYLIK